MSHYFVYTYKIQYNTLFFVTPVCVIGNSLIFRDLIITHIFQYTTFKTPYTLDGHKQGH